VRISAIAPQAVIAAGALGLDADTLLSAPDAERT